MKTELEAVNGKTMQALEVFAHALRFFRHQAVQVKPQRGGLGWAGLSHVRGETLGGGTQAEKGCFVLRFCPSKSLSRNAEFGRIWFGHWNFPLVFFFRCFMNWIPWGSRLTGAYTKLCALSSTTMPKGCGCPPPPPALLRPTSG